MSNILGTSLSTPIYCIVSIRKFFFPPSNIKKTITRQIFHSKDTVCMWLIMSVSLFISCCMWVCVWGKGGTHCLLPCCHWAVSPNQQPCRPDRRWARLLLQLILCSPSAAPDSAGRSPLEEGRWSDECKRVTEDEKKETGGGGEWESEKEKESIGICGGYTWWDETWERKDVLEELLEEIGHPSTFLKTELTAQCLF